MRTLLEKQDQELRSKKEKQSIAKGEMQKWTDNRKKEIDSRRNLNKEEEWAYTERKNKLKESPNPWEKVLQHVEMKAGSYPGKCEVGRMRSAMLARKTDLAKTGEKKDSLV
jgi:hypothetical protein